MHRRRSTYFGGVTDLKHTSVRLAIEMSRQENQNKNEFAETTLRILEPNISELCIKFHKHLVYEIKPLNCQTVSIILERVPL
jgi:hypothetical protein